MKESLAHYLSNKKLHKFRGNSYYKVKNYKASYYIDKNVFDLLGNGTQEVILEKNTQSNTREKGLIKWDVLRKQILISESKIRTYYQPFEIE